MEKILGKCNADGNYILCTLSGMESVKAILLLIILALAIANYLYIIYIVWIVGMYHNALHFLKNMWKNIFFLLEIWWKPLKIFFRTVSYITCM